jgi:hypothetical protein
MDPEQTLIDLLLSLKRQEREAAYTALEGLLQWLSQGGFFPDLSSPRLQATLAGLLNPLPTPPASPETELEPQAPDLVYRLLSARSPLARLGYSRLVAALSETEWQTAKEIVAKLPTYCSAAAVVCDLQFLVSNMVVEELERTHVDRRQSRDNVLLQNQLMLTELGVVPLELLAALTDEQYWTTADWVAAEIYSANDNLVLRYPRPEWTRAWPKANEPGSS